jgi:hypothetical protein
MMAMLRNFSIMEYSGDTRPQPPRRMAAVGQKEGKPRILPCPAKQRSGLCKAAGNSQFGQGGTVMHDHRARHRLLAQLGGTAWLWLGFLPSAYLAVSAAGAVKR